MNSLAIKHIEFWVSDLEHSIRFYKNIFNIIGWKHVEHNSFSIGETKIYFIEQKVKARKAIGPRHICFLAGSRKTVDRVADFLIKDEANIIRGPIDYRYRNMSSYTVDFRDPDGYVIEVATKSITLRK